MASDKNYVSFWFWIFAIIVSALPCVGIVFALVFAFAGENESRKNYFRASLVLQLLGLMLLGLLTALGLLPLILKAIDEAAPEWGQWLRGG